MFCNYSPLTALISWGWPRIRALHRAIEELKAEAESGRIKALIITGNDKFFSAGADLNEIAALTAARPLSFPAVAKR